MTAHCKNSSSQSIRTGTHPTRKKIKIPQPEKGRTKPGKRRRQLHTRRTHRWKFPRGVWRRWRFGPRGKRFRGEFPQPPDKHRWGGRCREVQGSKPLSRGVDLDILTGEALSIIIGTHVKGKELLYLSELTAATGTTG